jgi:hypothetical protein
MYLYLNIKLFKRKKIIRKRIKSKFNEIGYIVLRIINYGWNGR